MASGKSPALAQAAALKPDYGLDNHLLANLGTVYWNLPSEALVEEAIARGEVKMAQLGPIIANTGKHTGRSANDKFVVREPTTEEHIWWGQYNRPFAPEKFEDLYGRLLAYLQGRDLYVQDCYVGADPDDRMPVRVVTEQAWHSMFARNMFLLLDNALEYRQHVPDFTVIAAPGFKALPAIDGTVSNTFIVLNFEKRLCIIGNTAYAGEIKKSIFTVMNFLLPLKGALPMHCSANVEGGCYAKVINLSAAAEPQIFSTTRRFGTILENVVFDPVTRQIDLDDETITENTRASYPLHFIGNAIDAKRGGHPKNIILLTCDASGVMPPIAKLTPDQALYQFISGYTAKLAGTEAGLRDEPEITFSACFGGPFMVHHPTVYAALLKDKIQHYNVNCWLVNTGWVGGAYGIGKRISIKHTRALLNAALSGALLQEEFRVDPIFGFEVPLHCPEVPDSALDPAASWPSRAEHARKYRELASRFIENYRKFASPQYTEMYEQIRQAGPKL